MICFYTYCMWTFIDIVFLNYIWISVYLHYLLCVCKTLIKHIKQKCFTGHIPALSTKWFPFEYHSVSECGGWSWYYMVLFDCHNLPIFSCFFQQYIFIKHVQSPADFINMRIPSFYINCLQSHQFSSHQNTFKIRWNMFSA